MNPLRNRPYLLSRMAAVAVATTGGVVALLVVLLYLFGMTLSGPLNRAVYQASTGKFAIAVCVGLFLLVFGLLARAVFHMAGRGTAATRT